jgi:hypothetical protein
VIRWEIFLLGGHIPKIGRCWPSLPSTFWSRQASHPSAETVTSMYDEGTHLGTKDKALFRPSKAQWPCVVGGTSKTGSP